MLPDDSRLESIRRSLREKAGVEPSRHWLRDCWTSVQQQGLPNYDSALADEILYQILHHDLRDVVRVFERSDNHRSMDTTAPSMLLRQAIAQSQQAPSYKSDLPAFYAPVEVNESFSRNFFDDDDLDLEAICEPNPIPDNSMPTQQSSVYTLFQGMSTAPPADPNGTS